MIEAHFFDTLVVDAGKEGTFEAVMEYVLPSENGTSYPHLIPIDMNKVGRSRLTVMGRRLDIKNGCVEIPERNTWVDFSDKKSLPADCPVCLRRIETK